MGWININDRLPNDGETVLVWNNKYDEVTIQVYNEEYKCWDTSDGDDFDFELDAIAYNDKKIVEYWMPLPKKP